MTISKKRLYILVIGIVVGLAIIAGTTTAIVVTRPNTSAYNGTESDVSIGNLLIYDGTGYGINSATYNILMSKLVSTGYSGQQNASEINGGQPIIFQMGEANGNPIYWQVVFRTDDYITVWMCEPYQTGAYNSSTPYVTYDEATIRTTVNNIYSTLSTNYPILNRTTSGGIVATPSEMERATGATWQTQDQTNSIYSGSYTSTNDNLSEDAVNDGFWIPSFYEVANTSSSAAYTNNESTYTGLWGLNSTMRGFNGTVLSSGSSASYCWLRSGSL